ncbi:MAG: flagellar protein [Treponema sp.]|nr:flagellar protein [Treponema sp.]
MKRTFIFVVMALLLIGSLAFADEATIIDFTLLDSDIIAEKDAEGDDVTDAEGNVKYTQNARTVMDFGTTAGATFTDEQKDLMKTSLSLPNWEVVFNSSARNVLSMSKSVVVPAPVRTEKPNVKGGEPLPVNLPFAGKNIMGVRIVFPTPNVNANARIIPSFEIPAYEPLRTVTVDGNVVVGDASGEIAYEPAEEDVSRGFTRFEGGYGVVKNVGTIKALSVTTQGMLFPHALYVLLKDTDNIERRYFMGYLGFDGWKELKWKNPAYIDEVRTREIRIVPIYPRGLPFVKFVGFQIVRDAMHAGDDFIGYFKDVKVIYDKAVLHTERDIADEDLWGIVGDREAAKQNHEMARFGDKQVNRFLEKAKLAQEDGFKSSLSMEEDSSSDTKVDAK